eukprot:464714_1
MVLPLQVILQHQMLPQQHQEKVKKHEFHPERLRKKKEEMEMKDEEESITPILSQSQSDKMESDIMTTSNYDDFRRSVKEILDSPNTFDVPTQRISDPSPRVDRITIQNKTDREMEFLIPPKPKDDPIEIRERIRATLGLSDDPPQSQTGTTPFKIPQKSPSQSVSSSTSPMFNSATGLWSPNTPSYSAEYAEQVSKWLIFLIFSILTAIFCAYFQKEILLFFQSSMKPMREIWESMISSMGEIWESMISSISSVVSSGKDMLFQTLSSNINNETNNGESGDGVDNVDNGEVAAAESSNVDDTGSVTK